MTVLNIYSEISELLFISALPALIGIYLLVFGGVEESKISIVIGAVLLIIGALYGFFCVPEYQYYEVIINNLSEIDFAKFEIISQRGDIFVLKCLDSAKYLLR